MNDIAIIRKKKNLWKKLRCVLLEVRYLINLINARTSGARMKTAQHIPVL